MENKKNKFQIIFYCFVVLIALLFVFFVGFKLCLNSSLLSYALTYYDNLEFKSSSSMSGSIFYETTDITSGIQMGSNANIGTNILNSVEQLNGHTIYITGIYYSVVRTSGFQQISVWLYLSNTIVPSRAINTNVRYVFNNNTTDGNDFAFYQIYVDNSSVLNELFGTTDVSLILNREFVINQPFIDGYNNMSSVNQSLFDICVNQILPVLATPHITINGNLIQWSSVNYASEYQIYYSEDNSNFQYYLTVYTNMFSSSLNGYYKIIAVDSSGTFQSSSFSNIVHCTAYFNPISEYSSFNFYTLFSAIFDVSIFYLQSMLDFTIFGLNFYMLFKLIIVVCLTLIIVKFVNKKGS